MCRVVHRDVRTGVRVSREVCKQPSGSLTSLSLILLVSWEALTRRRGGSPGSHPVFTRLYCCVTWMGALNPHTLSFLAFCPATAQAAEEQDSQRLPGRESLAGQRSRATQTASSATMTDRNNQSPHFLYASFASQCCRQSFAIDWNQY